MPDCPAVHKPLAVAVLCLAAAGCSLSRGSTTTTVGTGTTTTVEPTSTGPAPAPRRVSVFRVEGRALRAETVTVPGAGSVAAASLSALGLDAPVRIDAGTARVERAEATPAEIAEIVYTLTQDPAVRRVDVAGRKGLRRADVADFVPPILVEQPASGARVGTTIRVAGTASVFEATLFLELRRAGRVVRRRLVTASEGAPGRGTFAAVVEAPDAGRYVIAVYSPSAADGRAQHEQDVTVDVVP